MPPTSDNAGQQDRISNSAATVICECCERPLPPGEPAKMDRESGVIICNECFEDLTAVSP